MCVFLCVLLPCLSSLHNEGPTFQCAMSSHSHFLTLSVFLYQYLTLAFYQILSIPPFLLCSVRLPFPEAMCLFPSTIHLLVSVFKLSTASLFPSLRRCSLPLFLDSGFPFYLSLLYCPSVFSYCLSL